jgi:dTDP-4-dehydrorhamnose 3,5-epimerase
MLLRQNENALDSGPNAMKVVATEFDRLVVVEPTVYRDARGYLLETWNESRFAAEGMPGPMVQDNLSWSAQGVLRGLHFQNPNSQAKLVMVLQGEIFDVAVDVRRGSPTFANWFGIRLSADNQRQVYIPIGFAHGFCVLSESALVSYKCSETYRPETEMTILWCDARLAIDWPISGPTVSSKDATAPRFDEIPPDRLPTWRPAAASR